MIKSPLRYPGGKSRVVERIEKYMPEFDEFREPFLGGGSVFIRMKQRFPDKQFWINDIYLELYKFWIVAQRDIDALIQKVYEFRDRYPDGKKLFRYLKDNLSGFDEVETAAAFFIFNRITFSGTTLSGGYSEGAFKGRFTERSIRRLNDLATVINGSKITNYDYEELLTADGENVFIFLDPPYYTATKSALYGKNGDLHKSFNHERFAENIKSCKHKWLITYDDSQYIRNLFSYANVVSQDMIYGMRNVTETSVQNEKELFISNFEPNLKYEQLTLF
ncbi:MAG: DNA adenine methylase [Candidatus Cloacimonetes bacterium]|nr:DNA adenine methylase [Candidatus Cloacimonadota bacterium]